MAPKLMMLLALQLSAASFAQSLDPSFGVNGTIQHDIGGSERLFGVTVQPDGRILGCGLRDSIVGGGHVLVCRFHEDGTFDNSFGSNGYVMLPTGTRSSDASKILMLADGRILVAGKTTEIDGWNKFMVRRLLSDGTVDSSFGDNGVWLNSVLPNGGYITDMALDGAGGILVAGMIVPTNYLGAFAVARLDGNGNLDTSFGDNGFFIHDESDQSIVNFISDMELLPDGRIVIVGFVSDLSTGPDSNSDILCVRLQANGQLDPGFGIAGKQVIDIQGMEDGANRIRIMANGDLELFGTSNSTDFSLNVVNRCVLSANGTEISTNLVPLGGWSPTQEAKQIADIVSGPGGIMSYIGSVPNGGTSDGFLGLLEPLSLQGMPYQAGYNTTVDPGDWTTFGGGTYDSNGRLLLVGLTTNPDWIGQFPGFCGAYTDLFLARYNMPYMTIVNEEDRLGLNVWPVPSNGSLNVECPDLLVDRLRLIDCAGRVVLDQHPRATGTLVIDLSSYNDGLYNLIMESGTNSSTGRVIVQH